MNEDKLLNAAEKAIYESITTLLVSYHSPVKDVVNNVMKKHEDRLIEIADNALVSILDSKSFSEAIHQAINDKVARMLVSQIGGEVEKRVNELKADPVTRAKITLALSQIASK